MRPSAEQREWASRLLASEGASESSHEIAEVAGRVYDKLHAHLDPLLGAAGVRALLVRSAKLTEVEFPFLRTPTIQGSMKLRECLREQEPTIAAAAAATLFGTFFALITTFIGERLTTQLLRSAWPTIEQMTPMETTK